MAVAERGKEARTRYEVLAPLRRAGARSPSWPATLETGRTHQIRVHLKSIGHPVVGDTRYGGARQSLPMARPFLHAEGLALDHPVTGEPLAFESPLPADLVELLAPPRPGQGDEAYGTRSSTSGQSRWPWAIDGDVGQREAVEVRPHPAADATPTPRAARTGPRGRRRRPGGAAPKSPTAIGPSTADTISPRVISAGLAGQHVAAAHAALRADDARRP